MEMAARVQLGCMLCMAVAAVAAAVVEREEVIVRLGPQAKGVLSLM